MKSLGLRLGLSAIVLSLLCQCAESPKPATPGPAADGVTPEETASVLVSNQELVKQLEVIRLEIQPGARAVAKAVLKNNGPQAVKLRVRTLFKDLAGVTVALSTWQTLIIDGNDDAGYNATASEPTARRILVQVEPLP
jgi:uncharacterized protein YcfL